MTDFATRRDADIARACEPLEERLVLVLRQTAELTDAWLLMLEGQSDPWPAEEMKEWHRQVAELDAEAQDLHEQLNQITGVGDGGSW